MSWFVICRLSLAAGFCRSLPDLLTCAIGFNEVFGANAGGEKDRGVLGVMGGHSNPEARIATCDLTAYRLGNDTCWCYDAAP